MPEGAAKELSADPDVFGHGQATYALRINDEYPVDVMPSVAGHSWEELSRHIQTLDLDGIALRVLSPEGLLLTKQGLRPKDQLDAAALTALIEANKSRTP